MSRTRWLILAVVLALGAVTGCAFDDFSKTGFGVKNDLDRTVQVSLVSDGVEDTLVGGRYSDVIEPGATGYFLIKLEAATRCSQDTILARDKESQEIVARILPPLCGSTETVVSKWLEP